jgi:hypothetical protein
MNKSILPILILAVFAGAAAGAAVSLALKPQARESAVSAPTLAADARTDDLTDAVARLELRLEEIDLAGSEVTGRVNRLEESESQRAAAVESAENVLDMSGVTSPVGPGGQVRMGGAPMIGFGSGKGMQLMGLSEDERWARLREELALDSYQESELKRIGEEMQAEIKDIFKIDPETGTLAGKLDLGKMMGARTKADEKVKNLLSAQQYEKYRKEGYSSALGMGGGVAISYTSTSVPRDRQGK